MHKQLDSTRYNNIQSKTFRIEEQRLMNQSEHDENYSDHE